MESALDRVRNRAEVALKDLDLVISEAVSRPCATAFSDELDECLKRIRNMLVGNPDKKLIFLESDIIPRCLLILQKSPFLSSTLLAVVLLSTLASHDVHSVAYFDQARVFQVLLKVLVANPHLSSEFQESLCSLLAKILRLPLRSKTDIFDEEYFPALMATFENAPRTCTIRSKIASMLASGCEGQHEQIILYQSPIKDSLFEMLFSSDAQLEEAGLSFFSMLVRHNSRIAHDIIDAITAKTGKPGLGLLLGFCQSGRPKVRFLALSCLVNLYTGGLQTEMRALMTDHVIPELLSMLVSRAEDQVGLSLWEFVPVLLRDLISFDGTPLRNPMRELGTVKSLLDLFLEFHVVEGREEFALACLSCIAQFVSEDEASRAIVCEDPKFLGSLCTVLEDGSAYSLTMRNAACFCLRGLSRSPTVMRKYIVDIEIVRPLLKLLAETSSPKDCLTGQLSLNVLSTLCNLLLSFSPLRKPLVDAGVLKSLASLLQSNLASSSDPLLLSIIAQGRCASALAVRNLTYQADNGLKLDLLSNIPPDILIALATHFPTGYSTENNECPQRMHLLKAIEHALAAIRNIFCANTENIDVFLGLFGHGQAVFSTIAHWFEHSEKEYMPLRIEALYLLANLCTNTKARKEILGPIDDSTNGKLRSPGETGHGSVILSRLVKELDAVDAGERIAALWCIINLSWKDDAGWDHRITVLKALHVEAKLRQIVSSTTDGLSTASATDPDEFNVRDRAKTALDNFLPQEPVIVI